jgi:hypothetical protein
MVGRSELVFVRQIEIYALVRLPWAIFGRAKLWNYIPSLPFGCVVCPQHALRGPVMLRVKPLQGQKRRCRSLSGD